VSAQLHQKRRPKAGNLVDYAYVNTKQTSPTKTVAAAGFAGAYDADKYADMLLDAAESIFGVFTFSRTRVAFQSRPKSFLEELRSERDKEILLELEILEAGVRRISRVAYAIYPDT